MVRRLILNINTDTGEISGKQLPLKEWVKTRIHEPAYEIVYKDDFATIYQKSSKHLRVYARTHPDAQRAIKNHLNEKE
jgi:hypothetical protein